MVQKILKDRLAPRWLRDLLRLLPVRSQFVFSGNIRDQFLIPQDDNGYRLLNLERSLYFGLAKNSFELLLVYDPVDGIRVFPANDEAAIQTAENLGVKLVNGHMPVALETLTEITANVVGYRKSRVALLIDYASRIPQSTDNLSPEEKSFFTAAEKLANSAIPLGLEGTSLFNPVIWLVNRVDDLPSWFTLDTERVHHVDIAKPDYDQRMETVRFLIPHFTDYESASPKEREAHMAQFAGLTDGFTLQAMNDVSQLAISDNISVKDIDDAVSSFKAGDPALDNPWSGEKLKGRIRNAEIEIQKRVLGQPQAIKKAMDLLKRSAMGLTGAQAKSSFGRPRGVLFLAGPTGVGKTELAKALTEEIFGDEKAYIRFDMSEFRAEHSDQRLLGAPPGYTGHDSGGELTNKVRQRPFSLILFDEIEKAHPLILDKFLQILEDGRLTDGRGETVYFSESIIVFTSNKGILERREDGSVVQLVHPRAEDGSLTPYKEVESKVLTAIKKYFTNEISRPEILNRLGDNIVVFNFISPEVGGQIFDRMLGNIKARIKNEHDITLHIEESPLDTLKEICLKDLTNGGRGIGNKLEVTLINPLSSALFDFDFSGANSVTVTSLSEREGIYYVTLQ